MKTHNTDVQRYRRQIVVDKDKVITVQLDVDWFHLFRELGEKAYRNRTKQTRACSGLIKVKIDK